MFLCRGWGEKCVVALCLKKILQLTVKTLSKPVAFLALHHYETTVLIIPPTTELSNSTRSWPKADAEFHDEVLSEILELAFSTAFAHFWVTKKWKKLGKGRDFARNIDFGKF